MKNQQNDSISYPQALIEATSFKVLSWIREYQGENEFLLSCKKNVGENKPLSVKQYNGLKKCYAYFLSNNTSTKKKSEINEDIDALLYQ